jgi:hypothetical protein
VTTRKTCPTSEDAERMALVIDWARRRLESTCRAESTVPMPPRAQRLHGREFYACGEPAGHDGPHRWPADGSIAEWL